MTTEWEKVDRWYDAIVGQEGHYYHKHVVLPRLLPLLDLESQDSPKLLDLGCGQGVLAEHLPQHVHYVGIDLAPSLIKAARRRKKKNREFVIGDICKSLPIKEKNFTHATIILALQNVAHPERALKEASTHLSEGGLIAIVLNHPCFRIPRQTHWGIDKEKKLQFRRVDRYLSPLKIPIQVRDQTTWSFHRSLSDYSLFLAKAKFSILLIEEWTSDKKSEGKAAKMENRAREEFPLFLTLVAQKCSTI